MNDPGPPVSIVFKAEFDEPSKALVESLREKSGLANGSFGLAAALPAAFWTVASENVWKKLQVALDQPVHEILGDVWSWYKPFLEYCNPDRYPPEKSVQKDLLQHTIKAQLYPTVDVQIQGLSKKLVIRFEVDMHLNLKAGTLTIQNGKLMSLGLARIDVEATLKCMGNELLKRKSRTLQLPGDLSFGAGMPIRSQIAAH
jgi:hypothetical protein